MSATSEPESTKNRPNRNYTLEPYSDEWPKEFERYASKIKDVFSDDAVRIEHMGSTAVPEMIAKHQIDILMEVADLSVVTRHKQGMAALGYASRGDFTQTGEEYFTLDDESGHRLVSLHIWPSSSPEIFETLALRDYLRQSAEERELYISVKKDLFNQRPGDYNFYGQGKRDTVEDIKQRASAWAKGKTKNRLRY